jgi:D-3-phosphoglycerate dehydrogenase
MTILGCDVAPDASLERYGLRYVGLEELLRESDFVTLHVPRLPETEGMIGEKELGLMKPMAYLINTARGGIVDEVALCRILKAGGIAGAALDVFDTEPPGRSELLTLDNLIATSHIASSTREAIQNVDANCYENVRRVLSGRQPLSAVNYPFDSDGSE